MADATPEIPKLGLSPKGGSPRAGSPRARASTPPPGRSMPKLSSANRSLSAKKARPASPLTPRQKKATRSLFRELGQTGRTIHHMLTRVRQTLMITEGTMRELRAAAESAAKYALLAPTATPPLPTLAPRSSLRALSHAHRGICQAPPPTSRPALLLAARQQTRMSQDTR